MINCQKSAITLSIKATQELKNRVKRDLAIPKEERLGKYLGLPDHLGRTKKDLFSMIVDRIRQRVVSWSPKQLFFAGKMVMLKSVFSAMPSYMMSCFKLPGSCCKSIQSSLTRFWWDSKPDKKKMC